ncbi:MAG: iron ABC transporter permease [Pseudomonadota bacterium]
MTAVITAPLSTGSLSLAELKRSWALPALLVLTLLAFTALPWYWDRVPGSALALATSGGRAWLAYPLLGLAAVLLSVLLPRTSVWHGRGMTAGSALALVWILLQGFAVGMRGLDWSWFGMFAPGTQGQPGYGWGAFLAIGTLSLLMSQGIAAMGNFRGDRFVSGAVWGIGLLVALFVFFPVIKALESAFLGAGGKLDMALAWSRLSAQDIWGFGCLQGKTNCGVAWNSLVLATLAGVGSTFLGLAFALLALRSGFAYKRSLRVMSILPIITPPFVIALSLVVLFGRTGIVTHWMDAWFGIEPSRWIYGLRGVLISQLLSQTPLAFLILLGVIQGISPTLEEASQTLRASHWHTFKTVTWPLMRPGIANTCLLGFVESLADFGNPLVLGGNFEVLSTKIFFAVAGAQNDPGRAAILALILLVFTLGAFWLQHRWLGRASYVTVTGKGDGGLPTPLPRRVAGLCYATAIPWAVFTLVLYALILVGGFVLDIGRGNFEPTLQHFKTGFAVDWGERGLHWSGSAWDSFGITVLVAAIAAPLTTVIGLLAAYVIARQQFAGRRSFEFMTMLSFAIPGTVIGIAYIVAFNVPPFEITGTGFILIVLFVFRNMPVGVRAGMAALSQIDRSLDEASLTLRAGTAYTLRRIMLPLLRPAIIATLVFSFVHAMTAVSAVIFLATAKYNMATVYIVGRVEAGEYALAIAYSTLLIIFMLAVILFIQFAVGERKLGRRTVGATSLIPGAH